MLGAYTGYHVSIIAGRRVGGRTEGGEYDLVGVHHGKTKSKELDGGLDWTDWDREGFTNRVMDQFVRFLCAAGSCPVPICRFGY